MSAVSGSSGGSQSPCGSGGANNNPSPLSPKDEKTCQAVAAAAAATLQAALGACPSCGNPSEKCPFNAPGEGLKPTDEEKWAARYSELSQKWQDTVKQQTQNGSSGTGGSSS